MKRGKDDKISFHNLNLHRVAFVWEILNGWGKIKINDHLSPTEAEIGAEFGKNIKISNVLFLVLSKEGEACAQKSDCQSGLFCDMYVCRRGKNKNIKKLI